MNLSQLTDKIYNESEVFEHILSLNDKTILELGCGKANFTRLIATNGSNRKITATEVDKKQHSKNVLIDELTNVTFMMAGSENIPLDDETFDIVFMFKSFHHVPEKEMKNALNEVKRVLKHGGIAYISEPIFDGDFNEVLRLFHDEQKVRDLAYSTISSSINNKDFISVDELFFNTSISFKNFEEFEQKIMNVTHTDHKLTSELYESVKTQFSLNLEDDGAKFLIPIRVNLLQK